MKKLKGIEDNPLDSFSYHALLSYRSVIYLKRKLRTCTIMIQPEKVGFLEKKEIFFRFFNFSANARGPPKNFDVQFSKIFE